MNNSQIDRDKPEVSIPDLIAEARERQAECAGLSEKEVSRTPISMILLNSTVAKLVNALESVTAPTENKQASRKPEAAPAKPVSDTDRCNAALSIRGAGYRCDLAVDHQGWAHSSRSADSIWADASVRDTTPPQPVQVEDERIFAWEEVVKHPAFTQCYPQERPLIVSVIARLDELVSMEQTMNELAPSRLAQQVQIEVTNEMVERAAHAIFAEEQCDRRQKSTPELLDENWRGRLSERDQNEYRSMARAALEAALTPITAVPVPEVIPGTRAALDGLSIRTTERGK